MEVRPSVPLEASLRDAYRGLQSGGSESCPSAETLASLALNEPLPERERLGDHVVSCRRCAEDYQILALTHSETRLASGRARRGAWMAAAAAVAVAAAAVLLLRSYRPEETIRGARARAASVASPTDGAVLAAAPNAFDWPAEVDADAYLVRLFDASGRLLWESEPLKTNRVMLPANARKGMADRGSYFWTVTAETPLEARRLGPYRFRLGKP